MQAPLKVNRKEPGRLWKCVAVGIAECEPAFFPSFSRRETAQCDPGSLCEAGHVGITPPIYDKFSETAGVCEAFYLGGLYIAGGAVAGVSALPQHAARRSSGTRRYELNPGSWYPPAVLCCTVLYVHTVHSLARPSPATKPQAIGSLARLGSSSGSYVCRCCQDRHFR